MQESFKKNIERMLAQLAHLPQKEKRESDLLFDIGRVKKFKTIA